MKTCVCCGRTFPDDVGLCPACGVNLNDPQESSAVQIEIDLEPEVWSPPREQTGFNEPVRKTMQTPVQPTLQITVDPGLRKLYRSNQCFYACRCLVGAVFCLPALASGLGIILSWEHLPYLPELIMEELRYGLETSDYVLAALTITAIVLTVLCFGRMVKPPEALLRDAKRSTNAYLRLFSFTDRCRITFGDKSSPFAKLIVLVIGFYSFIFMLIYPMLYFTDNLSSSNADVWAIALSTYGALWLIRLLRVKSIYKKNMP